MSNSLRIIADENMPFAEDAFSTIGEVVLMSGRAMGPTQVKEADILAIRSITRTDEQLLKESAVKFVGTATIGEDHVDKEYLAAQGIGYSSAPGCNANSVSEYIMAILLEMARAKDFCLRDKTLGIIGVGNVGSRVESKAWAVGMQVILNDPPLKKRTGDNKYRPLAEALQADIITLHVPLEKGGDFPTFHMADKGFLAALSDGAAIINASRGSVVDENDLLDAIESGRLLFSALDVWEHEPGISLELLEKIDIATPHIAGYSFEGKVNGTTAVYRAACKHFGIDPVWDPVSVLGEPIEAAPIFDGALESNILTAIRGNYDIYEDDRNMRELGEMDDPGAGFDNLRKSYRKRREFSNTVLKVPAEDKALEQILKEFEFIIG